MKGAFGNEGALRLSSHRRLELCFFAKQRQNLFNKSVGGETVLLPQDWDGAVFDELIGPADPHHGCVDHLRMKMFHNGAAKTVVQNVIFNRADDIHASGEEFQCAGVEGFDPSRIN